LKDTYVVSMSWLLWIMLQWIWQGRYLVKPLISFPSGVHQKVGFLSPVVVLFFIFWGNFMIFSIMDVPICIIMSSVLYKEFPFLHILINSSLVLNNSHPNKCEVGSHCGFYLYFPVISNVEHLFIYLSTGHFYIFFVKCLVNSFPHL
jgi:hypothetical protein